MPVNRDGRDRLDLRALGGVNRDRTVLWLVCHYPDTPETDERVAVAHSLQKELGLPIWLFGSRLACQQAATEDLIKAKLLTRGASPDALVCSGDMDHIPESFDTVQETLHVLKAAKARGIETVICISNRLQLWQVRGLARGQPVRLVYHPTTLREWSWWYLLARCTLIPLAFLGIGRRFPILEFVRRARARWRKWTV